MQTLDWLDTHLGSIDEAQNLINRFCWDLSVTEHENRWYVMTGDAEKHVIFSADNRAAVDAFIYGMAMTFAGLPPHIFESVEAETKAWIESL